MEGVIQMEKEQVEKEQVKDAENDKAAAKGVDDTKHARKQTVNLYPSLLVVKLCIIIE